MGKASTRAKNKYNLKNYDRINLAVPKGTKAQIAEHIKQTDDISINSFIKRAIFETIELDKDS